MAKEYDYLLKVLLVGDSDAGKQEILNTLTEEDSEGIIFFSS
jgi:Ras-related protein Rab-40